MKFGAHVSIRGAIHLAVDRAVVIGCVCLQIFVGSPRQWREIIYLERDLDLFVENARRPDWTLWSPTRHTSSTWPPPPCTCTLVPPAPSRNRSESLTAWAGCTR